MSRKKKQPVCAGTGLVALDILIDEKNINHPLMFAGGSCGNVLANLAYLGWESYPIARLSNDLAAKSVLTDLNKWDVRTNLISQTKDGRTPIIIQRNLTDKRGKPKHRFEFRCPVCGNRLPSYKAVLSKEVNQILDIQPNVDVFYFDRINRCSIELAKHYKKQDALVIFEPSSIKEIRLFKECLENTHIIKFSNDRIKNYNDLFPNPQGLLEIETRNSGGLVYRSKMLGQNEWIEVSSYHAPSIIDSSGAGDWCTAALINKLGLNGIDSLIHQSEESIQIILKHSQLYSAINCHFPGARGLAYNIEVNELKFLLGLLENKKEVSIDSIKEPLFKDREIESFRPKVICDSH